MDLTQLLSLEADSLQIPEGIVLEASVETPREIVQGKLGDYRSLSYLEGYEFDDRYYGDRYGNVISVKSIDGNLITGTLMSPYINRDHYVEFVLLDKNKKLKHINAQRIVAGLYIPRVAGKLYVNHKDGNRQNNNVNNLEWVNHSENITHSWNQVRPDPNKYDYKRRLPGQTKVITRPKI